MWTLSTENKYTNDSQEFVTQAGISCWSLIFNLCQGITKGIFVSITDLYYFNKANRGKNTEVNKRCTTITVE